MATKDKTSAPKKKKDIKLSTGVIHVHTTDNNTVIALVDDNGNKLL